MSHQSAIEWTDHTFNPWWGCTKVSAGCTYCYAETLANRYGHGVWGPRAQRRLFGEKHWDEPIKWNRVAEQNKHPAKVFCASMADVFENNRMLEAERQKLWLLIEETPWLQWQLLTKRPENVCKMVPWYETWPSNVWIGTSIENTEAAEKRLPHIRGIPAVIRFLSCEPLIGPLYDIDLTGIHWVIVGGESGPKHRPIDIAWVRALRDQSQQAGVAFFFKQWGGLRSKSGGRRLDGRFWNEFPNAPTPAVSPQEM